MKKYFIVILILIVIFISACKTQEVMKEGSSNLLSYEDKDFGISFKYPKNFKLYQENKYIVNVDSGYEDPQDPLVRISIGIRKISTNKESLETVKSITQHTAEIMKTEVTYKIQNKDGYDIVIVESSSDVYFPYYILSDKGLFVVDHPSPIWEKQLSEDLYLDYKTKFDAVIDSIKII